MTSWVRCEGKCERWAVAPKRFCSHRCYMRWWRSLDPSRKTDWGQRTGRPRGNPNLQAPALGHAQARA